MNKIIYHYTSNTSAFNILSPIDDNPLIHMQEEMNNFISSAGFTPNLEVEDNLYKVIEKEIRKKDPKCKIFNLRASSVAYLNDPTEIHHGFELFKKYASTFVESDNSIYSILKSDLYNENILEFHKQNVFLLSFSKLRNDLNQWRLYGNDGKGICLGIDTSVIPSEIVFPILYKVDSVEYSDRKVLEKYKKGNNYLFNLTEAPYDIISRTYKKDMSSVLTDFSRTVFLITFFQIISCAKNRAFKSEQEIRLVFQPLLSSYLLYLEKEIISFKDYSIKYSKYKKNFYVKDEKIISYKNIPFPLNCIKEIWLGPKNPNTAEIYQQFVNSIGLSNVKIYESKLPYQ